MDVDTEKNNDAVVLATSIFVAGFFLGVGTGMLLAPQTGSGSRERLKKITEDLVGSATKAFGNVLDTGERLLKDPGTSGK